MLCKVLKLNTGETVMGNITEETRSYIDVHRPLRIVVVPKNNGAYAIALTRWEPISNFEYPIRLFKQAIVSVSEPHDEFRDNYVEIYNQYESKEIIEQAVSTEDKEDDTSENLTKIEEMLKAMMESNTTHTLH
jgi:hypothetical protein